MEGRWRSENTKERKRAFLVVHLSELYTQHTDRQNPIMNEKNMTDTRDITIAKKYVLRYVYSVYVSIYRIILNIET